MFLYAESKKCSYYSHWPAFEHVGAGRPPAHLPMSTHLILRLHHGWSLLLHFMDKPTEV